MLCVLLCYVLPVLDYNREEWNEVKKEVQTSTCQSKGRLFSLADGGDEAKQCIVINISLNGAGLEFYAHESVEVGTTLFLKVFDREGKKAFDTEGIVRWGQQGEKDFVCGIELTTVLDKFTLSTLGIWSTNMIRG